MRRRTVIVIAVGAALGALPTTAFNLARGQSVPDLELTTWRAPNTYDGFDRVAAAGPAPIIGTITTEWKESANVRVKSATFEQTVKADTLAGGKSTLFTLVLGGGSNTSAVPNVEIVVTELCVRFG